MPFATSIEFFLFICIITNPSPPILDPDGSATPREKATEIIASTAFPPLFKVFIPACAAKGWLATTAPFEPICGGL